MPPKTNVGPLTDEEVTARMNKLEAIIAEEAQKEINQISTESDEDIDEMKKALIQEPRQVIDEWVEKLRAFTERQTKIHCARLRRIAKLRILEAYGDIKESIKNEARERIKEKMSKKGEEIDKILREMLFQGLLRLMESKVLVHTTKADLERVSRSYDWATSKYKEITGMDLKLISSRHPLKDHYFGRIVISDKASSMFVDMNLFTNVDTVADEVFTHYAAYQDKAGTSRNWGMEALKQRGLHIMPRGPNITANTLDSILSTMRGDPRTQVPVFQIKEEEKKQVGDGGDGREQPHATNTVNSGKSRKVTIATDNMQGMKPSLSMMEPTSVAPSKYNYRQNQDTSEHIVGPSHDLYNLEYTSNTDLLSQQPSKSAMTSDSKKLRISADKEVPVGNTKQHGTYESSQTTQISDENSDFSQNDQIYTKKPSSSPTKDKNESGSSARRSK